MSASNVVKVADEDRYMLCVVYSPSRLPLRGKDKRVDLVSPRTLEVAAWSYLAKGAPTGMWHEDGHDGVARCVESYLYRNPVPWDVNGDGSLVVKEGDWLAGFILSTGAWGLFKSGEIGGVSFQGSCGRKPASADAVARVRKELEHV